MAPKLPDKIVILRRAPRGGIAAPARGYGGGQFIPAEIWQQERRKAAEGMPDLLDRFSDQMQYYRQVYEMSLEVQGFPDYIQRKKWVPLDATEHQMKVAIRQAYDDAFQLGWRAAGNLSTPPNQTLVKKTRIDEYIYLRKFLKDISDGAGRMPYDVRMDYYAFAARELYNLGFVLANLDPRRRITWKLGKTEKHCELCPEIAAKGPIPVRDFVDQYAAKQILPQSGRLPCLGRYCDCRLEESFA